MAEGIFSKEKEQELMEAGIPLPRISGTHPTQRELDIARLVGRLKEAGGRPDQLSASDQAAYSIYRDRGELPVERQETAAETINRGLREQEFKRQAEAAEAMKELEGIATEALKARRKAVWSDFRTKMVAEAENRALLERFEAAVLKINDTHIRHCTTPEFRELAAGHVNQLRQCFSEPFEVIR